MYRSSINDPYRECIWVNGYTCKYCICTCTSRSNLSYYTGMKQFCLSKLFVKRVLKSWHLSAEICMWTPVVFFPFLLFFLSFLLFCFFIFCLFGCLFYCCCLCLFLLSFQSSVRRICGHNNKIPRLMIPKHWFTLFLRKYCYIMPLLLLRHNYNEAKSILIKTITLIFTILWEQLSL